MASPGVDRRSSPPALGFGRVLRLHLQVGFRASPDASPYEQFLLDAPLPEDQGDEPFDHSVYLTALEPVVFAGTDVARHYSLHQHRWHSTWGPAPGTVEIGVTVTMGTAPRTEASYDAVSRAFEAVLDLVAGPESPPPLTRDIAVLHARRAVAASFAVDADLLALAAEEHTASSGYWRLDLRGPGGDEYDVVVGFVRGLPGAVHVIHQPPAEVFDSVGIE